MAIQPILNFEIQLQGDGTATTCSFPISTAPISFIPSGTLSPAFSLGGLVRGIENLTCSDPTITVTGSILLETMTLDFSPALQVGIQYTVAGTFLF